MTDLWTEASRDFDAEGRARNLEMAKAASQGTWEFLALARSPEEYGDRVALAADQITATASGANVEVADLVRVFDTRFALLMEAGENPFAKDDSDDDDSSDDGSDKDDSDDDGDDDSDSDDGGDDDDSDDSDDDDDDSSKDEDDSDDKGSDDDGSSGDSSPPWADKFAALAKAIQSGANPLEWGGTPFARSSAREDSADGAAPEEGAEPVSDLNGPAPVDPVVPGMNGGIAETTKPRQTPDGGGMDPTMAPGMGLDGIGAPPADDPTDPGMNGGDVQQGADDLPPADDAEKTAKIKAIAAEVRRYNPTLSSAQCRKVAQQVFDRYLVKHAEDMSPLLFGDRGGVGDGPATHKVKTWAPKDFNPQKPEGEGGEEEGPGVGGGGPGELPRGIPLPRALLPGPSAPAAAGVGAEVGEAAAAARMLPLLAL